MKKHLDALGRYRLRDYIRVVQRKFFLKDGIPEKERKMWVDQKEKIDACRSLIQLPFDPFLGLGSLTEEQKNAILCGADFVCDDKTNCLIDGVSDLGHPVSWLRDYVSGQNFPLSKEEISRTKSDIKRVWELSRMHQLIPLLRAGKITGKNCYYEKIESLISSWFEQNYGKDTVNWQNPMEISIRCVNLIYVVQNLPVDSEWTKKLTGKINQILYRSGLVIRYHLENKGFVLNNHYLSDLVGLLSVSLYFIKGNLRNRQTESWWQFALKQLYIEISNQIYPDGVCYEISIPYHGYVMELLTFISGLMQCNGTVPEPKLQNCIKKMRDFLLSVSPGGRMPVVGDDDSSKLLRLSYDYPFENLNDCRELIRRADAVVKASGEFRTNFPMAGYYLISQGELSALFVCGPLSCRGHGGHSHNDQLSFQLFYRGELITGDPGTYCYTSDLKERNRFRGTSMHSTVQVGELEQNPFDGCFRMPERTKSRIKECRQDYLCAEHSGFLSETGAVHQRTLSLSDGSLTVEDRLSGEVEEGKSFIVFSPEITLGEDDLLHKGSLIIRIVAETQVSYDVIPYATAYGRQTKALRAALPVKDKLTYSLEITEE